MIGERTFGTGTVLSEFQLTDGSALLLAVQQWLTPSLHSFWHRGLEPDIRVALPAGASALEPAVERGMTAEELEASSDAQLRRAIEWLSSHSARK